MRLFALLCLAVAFFYAFYVGAAATWSYLELSSVVDRALEDRGRAGAVALRESILQGARQSGLPIDPQRLVVTEETGTYSIQAQWTWPVITYKGEDLLEIPLSLQRSARRF